MRMGINKEGVLHLDLFDIETQEEGVDNTQEQIHPWYTPWGG